MPPAVQDAILRAALTDGRWEPAGYNQDGVLQWVREPGIVARYWALTGDDAPAPGGGREMSFREALEAEEAGDDGLQAMLDRDALELEAMVRG